MAGITTQTGTSQSLEGRPTEFQTVAAKKLLKIVEPKRIFPFGIKGVVRRSWRTCSKAS